MNQLAPISITRPKPFLLKVDWNDGFSATVKLEDVRNECPCAVCKGEEIMGHVVLKPQIMFTPGMFDLTSISSVGNYAIAAVWGDGHDTGIYSWDILRYISEKYKLTDAQIADFEIKKQLPQIPILTKKNLNNN